MPRQFNQFMATRLTTIVDELQDYRLKMQETVWSKRVPRVNANKGEIYGEYFGTTQIAPIIALNAEAPTFRAGRISTVATTTTKIKHGAHFTEDDLDEMLGWDAAYAAQGAQGPSPVDTVLINAERDLLTGIEWRKEALIMAMILDDSYSYDHLGIKFTAGWGRPQSLKVTASVPWTDTVNADPVTDILALKQQAQYYGLSPSRISMSTQAFRQMIQCAKFQAYAKEFIPPQLTISVINIKDLARWGGLAEMTLGMTIEIRDERYDFKTEDGLTQSARFQPIGTVILSDPGNDGNAAAWDMAQAPVVEASLMGMMDATGVIGRLPGGRRGPVSYATTKGDMNPPGLTVWAVDNAFPRAKRRAIAATLKVGTFNDEVPVTQAYPA